MDWNEKREKAAYFIEKCCSHAGSFSGTSDVHNLLRDFSAYLSSKSETVYGGRRREHIAHALELVVRSAPFKPEGAIATPYLITQIEYSLRRLSEYVDDKGFLVKSLPCGLAGGKRKGDRIELDRLYKIIRDSKDDPVSQALKKIDGAIKPYKVGGRAEDISHLADRLHWLRNEALHGCNADVSCEGLFLGLLLLILYSGLVVK